MSLRSANFASLPVLTQDSQGPQTVAPDQPLTAAQILCIGQVLNKLYTSMRLFVNFFQPSFKLLSKIREGAKVIKKYHPPATPCERLLERKDVSEECNEQLQQTFSALDPVRLLSEIREAQRVLAQREVGVAHAETAPSTSELSGFVASFSTVWRDGEVRPTHRK